MNGKNKELFDFDEGLTNLAANTGNNVKAYELHTTISDNEEEISGLKETFDKVKADEFSYVPAYDPVFQEYANQYMRNGQLAAKNAIAESSILTGGYGNSWAASAGAQAFNSYMNELNDVIPELRAAAYDDWSAKRNEELDDLSAAIGEREKAINAAEDELKDMDAYALDELVRYIAQGVMDDVITEDDIEWYLPAYDDTFTEEEISVLRDEVLAVVEEQKRIEAEEDMEKSGIIADIIATVTKTPALNTEEYISAALGEHGLSYEDYKDRFEPDKVKKGEDGDSGKTPTGTMMNEAAELYYQYGIDGLDKWATKYPDYSIDKAISYVLVEHPDIWEVTQNETEEGVEISTSKKLLKDRNWEVTDNGGPNWGGEDTIDNNARVKDQYGDEYRLDDLLEAMVEDGSFESVEKAKEWLVSQKFGVKGGKLAKEEK